MVMRYAKYREQLARLDKEIAECVRREAKAASGHPWYFKVMPILAAKAIEVASNKRGELARARARLERETFSAASLIWNAEPTAVFRRTVPGSEDAVERLRAAADAAFDLQTK
jgi:hypothetical protein